MKRKSVLSIVGTAIGAYLLRRGQRHLTVSRLDAQLVLLFRRIFFRTVTVRAVSKLWAYQDQHTIVPKWLRYGYSTLYPKENRSEHSYRTSSLLILNKVPCWIEHSGPRSADIHVPAWWYKRAESALLEMGHDEKPNFTTTSVYTPSPITPDEYTEFEWVRYTLDDIPIHSETRKRLDGHVADMLREWVERKNGEYSRNILLHGLKGSGKTHIVQAMARALSVDSYEFPIVETRKEFRGLLYAIPMFSVMFCDEMQEVPQFKKETLVCKASEFSKRDALDFLSGITARSGVFSVYCTNDLDALDERIQRTGRFKDKIEMGVVDDAGLRRWLAHVHNYIVPKYVTLKEMSCAEIFHSMDTLDDPELFVIQNSTLADDDTNTPPHTCSD